MCGVFSGLRAGYLIYFTDETWCSLLRCRRLYQSQTVIESNSGPWFEIRSDLWRGEICNWSQIVILVFFSQVSGCGSLFETRIIDWDQLVSLFHSSLKTVSHGLNPVTVWDCYNVDSTGAKCIVFNMYDRDRSCCWIVFEFSSFLSSS